MPERPEPGRITAAYVEARLESAGRALMALPWAGCFPAGLRSLWPEVADNSPRRWDPPTSRAISDMDEAYRWCGLIADAEQRKLVLMRSLVWPDSPSDQPRYKYPWRELRRITGLHSDTLRVRWGRGIDTIVTRLNRGGQRLQQGGTPAAPFALGRRASLAPSSTPRPLARAG
jgi:hypothetical protein